jgi:hypothetical protein
VHVKCGFQNIFRIKAAFGIVLRVIGGFLNAAKRLFKEGYGRIFIFKK